MNTPTKTTSYTSQKVKQMSTNLDTKHEVDPTNGKKMYGGGMSGNASLNQAQGSKGRYC